MDEGAGVPAAVKGNESGLDYRGAQAEHPR